MKKIFSLLVFSFISLTVLAQKDFYELRVYEMKFGSPASGLHNYLEKALFPALNQHGIKNIGAFEEWSQDNPSKIYVFIPFESIIQYDAVKKDLAADQGFAASSAEYNQITTDKAPFSRYETFLFNAFSGIPRLLKPDAGSQVFELRTYEGYIEDAYLRKVKMFNDSELQIFKETGLHSVFFGERIAGGQMPCLTYMLSFKDMEERDANWKKFSAHPEWKRIVGLPEYANTVSNIHRVFLKPLKYSQL
ncbi:NIPSNAP family containing protein [Lacihabitans sp. LS3-19]|uniref:NIPSNAP family protein n=1 Tax=Lacihabitans sp. LS3-19 TaxID=2487335 RepID=UPI0020CBB449|nr:NIPSNAP family protein [Lacihabitans sp. LS3-19]MCP9766533.1 NIPSNAP family containing protein [Lacihabitans sp. LS3-19]